VQKNKKNFLKCNLAQNLFASIVQSVKKRCGSIGSPYFNTRKGTGEKSELNNTYQSFFLLRQ